MLISRGISSSPVSPRMGAARIPAEGGSVSHRRARLLPLRTVPQDIAQDIALIKPLQVAIEAAHAASEPILERFRAADLSVDNKGDVDRTLRELGGGRSSDRDE